MATYQSAKLLIWQHLYNQNHWQRCFRPNGVAIAAKKSEMMETIISNIELWNKLSNEGAGANKRTITSGESAANAGVITSRLYQSHFSEGNNLRCIKDTPTIT
jgi:hypothetical protein